MTPLRVIDSHTGGEPTRLVVEGLPELQGSVQEKLDAMRRDHDLVRRCLCLEPRGNEVAVGAALFSPSLEACLADIVFFNNEGYLGMCGHGTIGVLATLAWKGDITPGTYQINTVAGVVTATLHDLNTVSFDNVPAYRWAKSAVVDVPGYGQVMGDVAYGGNWFFLVKSPGFDVRSSNLRELLTFTSAVMEACPAQGVTGKDGALIDHIEVYGTPTLPDADSKNFVLCPGGQYDRSPCGTGTSAKLACLYEDDKLAAGEVWRQESVIGSLFEGFVTIRDGQIVPTIKGSAFVTAESQILVDPQDPFAGGIEL